MYVNEKQGGFKSQKMNPEVIEKMLKSEVFL